MVQPYRSVAINGTAEVKCYILPPFHQVQLSKAQSSGYTYHSPEQMRVSLLKGLQDPKNICSSQLKLPQTRDTRVEKQEEVGLNYQKLQSQ